jgi:hypothetical protein
LKEVAMPIGTLVVCVSEGDPRIGTRVFGILNGLEHTGLERYWKGGPLGGYVGAGVYPLVLIGHATGTSFSTQCATTPEGHTYALQREPGGTLAAALMQRGLQRDTFPFCLIAGCQAASERGIGGLYASVGDLLDMPVVASTTPVALGITAGVLTSRATGGGKWMGFFPLGGHQGGGVPLAAPQCSAIRDTLGELGGWLSVG